MLEPRYLSADCLAYVLCLQQRTKRLTKSPRREPHIESADAGIVCLSCNEVAYQYQSTTKAPRSCSAAVDKDLVQLSGSSEYGELPCSRAKGSSLKVISPLGLPCTVLESLLDYHPTMRFVALLLILGSPLCSALAFPDQEVFEFATQIDHVTEDPDASDSPFGHAFSQTEDSDAESWWGVRVAMAAASHGDVALNSPDAENTPDENVGVPRGDDEQDDLDDDDGDDSDDDDDDEEEDGDEDEDQEEDNHEDKDKEPSQTYQPELLCPKNHTIWELINQNASTARLAELLSNEDDLISLLNDPEVNHTLFAPTNSSLGRFLGGRPSHRTLRQIEHYHIVPGFIPTDNLRRHQTIPTARRVSSLGKHGPQRIVVDLRRDEVVLNGLSRVIGGDMVSHSSLSLHGIILRLQIATNGMIHQISHPLLPPPNTSTILHSSQATSARSSTDWRVQSLHPISGNATASEEPTNTAFQRLSPRVNEFLFSPRGRKCLRALLEYHIVRDRTLYSDAFYDKHGRVDEYGRREEGDGVVHIELPTLPRRKRISVDVARRGMEVLLRVNGFWQIVTLDMVAADGVVHVLDEVLVPPRRIGVKEEEGLTVDDLKKRLGGCGERGTSRREL